MAKAAKPKKKKAETYDPKLKINSSFEDVIKVSVTRVVLKKEESKPTPKKSRK